MNRESRLIGKILNISTRLCGKISNYRHLANPNKFQRIRFVNTSLGLYIPALVTPNQLIGESND